MLYPMLQTVESSSAQPSLPQRLFFSYAHRSAAEPLAHFPSTGALAVGPATATLCHVFGLLSTVFSQARICGPLPRTQCPNWNCVESRSRIHAFTLPSVGLLVYTAYACFPSIRLIVTGSSYSSFSFFSLSKIGSIHLRLSCES